MVEGRPTESDLFRLTRDLLPVGDFSLTVPSLYGPRWIPNRTPSRFPAGTGAGGADQPRPAGSGFLGPLRRQARLSPGRSGYGLIGEGGYRANLPVDGGACVRVCQIAYLASGS